MKQDKVRIRKGIILAAGDGDRFGSLTAGCPKVLLPLSSQDRIISYPIRALAACGIREIAIITGYLGDMVRQALGDGSQFGVELQYLNNSDYKSGNAISVLTARNWANGDRVILCMGDHIIEEKLVACLVDNENSDEMLCVDYCPAQHHRIEEATKVAVDRNHCIRDIGKGLARWNAIDTGVFLLTERFFQTTQELVEQIGTDIETADVVRCLIARGHQFHACDVSGCFWMDVDTEEDLNLVRL